MERYLPLLVIWLHLAEKAVHPIEDLSPITEVIARREFHKLSRDCFFPTNNNEDDISKKRIIFKPWANRRKSFIFLKFFREFCSTSQSMKWNIKRSFDRHSLDIICEHEIYFLFTSNQSKFKNRKENMVKFVEIIFWQNLLTILLSKGHLKNHLTLSCILRCKLCKHWSWIDNKSL